MLAYSSLENLCFVYILLYIFPQPTSDMHRDAKQLGVEIIISESFINDPGIAVENLKVSLIVACFLKKKEQQN